MIREPHLKPAKKKLFMLIASVVLVMGLLIALAFWLKANAETGAKASIEKSRTSVSSAIKTLNTKLVDPKLAGKDRVGVFSELDQTLQKVSSDTCSAESKNIMFALSSAKKECDTVHQKIMSIQTTTKKIQQNVKDDQVFSTALVPIQSADAANPEKQLEAWGTVATNLAKADVSQDATNLKNQLVAAASNYKTVWQELIDANKAQNKANYNAAIKKLDAAKEELTKVAASQTDLFKTHLADFKKAVELFKK